MSLESDGANRGGVAKIKVWMPDQSIITFTEAGGSLTARLCNDYIDVGLEMPYACRGLGILSGIRQFILSNMSEDEGAAVEIMEAVEEARVKLEKSGYPSEIAMISGGKSKCERIKDSSEKDYNGEYWFRQAKVNIAGLLFTVIGSLEAMDGEYYKIVDVYFRGYDNSLEQYKGISGRRGFEYELAAAVGYTLGMPHKYISYNNNLTDDEEGIKRFCEDAGLDIFDWIMFNDIQ